MKSIGFIIIKSKETRGSLIPADILVDIYIQYIPIIPTRISEGVGGHPFLLLKIQIMYCITWE